MTGGALLLNRRIEHRGRGIALRIGAVTAFSAMMAALKYGAEHGVGPIEILFYRNLFSFPTILGWVLLGGGVSVIRTNRPMAHVTRSTVGLIVMFLTFLALSMLPLAEATAISFSAPLFATILSAIVLREKVMWHRWSAIVLGFIGVLIIVQPGGSALPLRGVLIGLVSALGTGVIAIMLRQIAETESATVTVFWFNVACLAVTALPMPFLFHNHEPQVWIALALGGFMGGIAQILMTSALRYAPVSVLAPFDYLQIVWATIWGFVLFAALPSAAAILGAGLIALAGIYVVWRERKMRKPVVPAPSEL